jgi:hypothetical protein
MEWAMEMGEAKRLSPDARAVLVAVAYWANRKSGWSWASRAEIQDKTGFGEHRVIRALVAIEAAEIVGVERRPGRTTRWGPFPVLEYGANGHTSDPRDRARDLAAELSTTRATGGATGRATGGATPARPGARDPLETPMNKPRAVAAPRRSSTWVATHAPTPNLSDLPD